VRRFSLLIVAAPCAVAPNGNDYGKDLLRQHYERSPH